MSQKFCIICCYSSQEQNRSVSNEAREHFDKFCTDLGFSFPTRVDEQLEKWCLKLPFGDSVTVCSNCLSEIVQYAQKRSMQLEQQDKLEELQKAVVKALKDLTVVVKDVETHINKLHTIMRNGDETCLDNFVKNASPKSTRKAEVRSFREKILLISNEGSRPQHTFGLHHDMILPVVSSRRKDKLKLKVCKEEPTDPIDATCKYEEDFEEPYAEAVDEVSMELADDDFKGTMASGNFTSSRSRHGRGSLISKRNRKSRVSKKATKKRKQFSNMDTDNNAADAYIHCEFGDRDTDTEHDSAPQLALRRTKRQIRSTLIKQEADELELESDDGGGMEDAYSEDDGSNFSDVDADFRMLKGKQNFRSDSGSESDSSIDSAPVIDTETESIVCDVDVYETKPKRSKKKKKHKSSKPRVSLKGMSEFKTRVVNRVLRKLRRNSEGGHSTKDDYDGNGNNDNKKDTTDDVSDKIGVQSLNDPRMKYPLKFNAETRKLTVNDIEIVIDDNEMSLRCSLCDFEISEAEIRNKVRVKNVETVAHDHIIGSHIGSYKCGVSNSIMSHPHSGISGCRIHIKKS
ncbi:unnamed protein product [Orchesella dallaii]|uniref:ZAD domain-containing protein n=1 Tax=Orchesella dallaii TaxID=48710 RepID=A0ABP1QFJ3_9HEXA